jgi:predicted dehydrogenase
LDSTAAVVRRDDIDAVFVLVSVTAVAAVAAEFLKAGLPTFLEKPPGLYSADTAQLAELAQRQGAIAMVGLNRRFYASHLALQQRLEPYKPLATVTVEAHEDMALLPVRWAATRRREIPEVVLRRWAIANGIHALDLLRFFGGEVAEVHSPLHGEYEQDFPDAHTAVLRFANGTHGRALIDWMAPGHHRFDLRGVGIRATSQPGFGVTTLAQRGEEDVLLEPDADDLTFKPGFWKQDSAFLDTVRQGRAPQFPAASLADAHRSMVLIEQICHLPDRECAVAHGA